MSVDYNYRNAFDLHSLTQSFEPQLDSNKIYKETCPKISELPCTFPLPACCGAPNQSICPLYFFYMVNCRLGHKTTRFTGKTLKVSWDRGRVNCERRAIIVMATDVLNFTSSDGFGVDILFLR